LEWPNWYVLKELLNISSPHSFRTLTILHARKMMFISAVTAAALALLSTSTTASPIVQERQTAQGNFALAIQGGRFDLNYLQSFNLFYANTSAWIGQVSQILRRLC
jgi:hypothetical protein